MVTQFVYTVSRKLLFYSVICIKKKKKKKKKNLYTCTPIPALY